MSDHSQTAANKPSDSTLCKMGCGFFGSGATGDCCSKCWRELQKKEGAVAAAAQPKAPEFCPPVEEPEPMEVEAPVMKEEKRPAPAPTPKKKSKKTSYKNMMAGMMKSSPERDVEKEKESLRKVTGGGAFSKIDKI